jgi:exosome complex exonuclease DIS3/RRP44
MSGERSHSRFPGGHFVLPDTNVFLHQVSPPSLYFDRDLEWDAQQMDLMESASFTPPIILLQTVLEEIRHRSLPLLNRLKALMKAEENCIWIFYNEYRT